MPNHTDTTFGHYCCSLLSLMLASLDTKHEALNRRLKFSIRHILCLPSALADSSESDRHRLESGVSTVTISAFFLFNWGYLLDMFTLSSFILVKLLWCRFNCTTSATIFTKVIILLAPIQILGNSHEL